MTNGFGRVIPESRSIFDSSAAVVFSGLIKSALRRRKGTLTMTHPFASPLPAQKAEDLALLASLLQDLATSRRGLMFAPFIAALPASLISDPVQAIDPNETQVTLPDQFQWKPGLPEAPSRSVETVPVFGATDKPGPYVVLVRWYPGYMSAPHTYVTDRLCFVLSGTPGGGIRARLSSRRRPCRCRRAALCAASRARRTTTA
jgi:hypothetical protein